MQYKKKKPKKILKVYVSCAIAKPLNGSLPRSNTSHMLRLTPITYKYKNGKTEKKTQVQTYLLKGLRGAVRHAVMGVCNDIGLEVCHTTDKETTKDGTSLLPSGFHLLGSCGENGESCIVHNLFGSMRKEGKITVCADPIANILHKTGQVQGIQNVHIATENRICLTYDRKTAQDFSERYFSGNFTYEVDVTECSLEELGLLIHAVVQLDRYSRGYNAGYGHLKTLKLSLLSKTAKHDLICNQNDGTFDVHEAVLEESLQEEVLSAQQAWEDYIAAHS